jgi:hypothetical protein
MSWQFVWPKTAWPWKFETLLFYKLEDEVNEMVLEPVYLTQKLRYIIQMFGSIVSACWLQIHLSFFANFSEQFTFSMNMFFSLLFRY